MLLLTVPVIQRGYAFDNNINITGL